MTKAAGIFSFGNFLRTMIGRRWRVTEFAELTGISYPTLNRYIGKATSEEANPEPVYRNKLADALGFKSWDELDAAWRSTPLPPAPKRSEGRKADRLDRIIKAIEADDELRRNVREAIDRIDQDLNSQPPLTITSPEPAKRLANAARDITARRTGKVRYVDPDNQK